jgi:hypothetical protein
MLRVLSGQLAEQGPSTWVTLSIRDTNVLIESFVMFSIVWSIGANCAPADRGGTRRTPPCSGYSRQVNLALGYSPRVASRAGLLHSL